MRSDSLSPLYGNCQTCRTAPRYITRQRPLGARAVGAWRTACAGHAPKDGQFHETMPYMADPHSYGNAPAAYAATTPFGTFYLCRECHEAGHGPSKIGETTHKPLTDDAPHVCNCEHYSHCFD